MTRRSLSVNLAALSALSLSALLVWLLIPGAESKKASLPEDALRSVNERVGRARNAFCPSVRMGLFHKSLIFYEKPDKIMFISGSALRDEALIGCDGIKYWFWMRSFENGSLFFCDLDKLDDTRVIPLMRPEAVKCMAWIDEVEGRVSPTARGFRAESESGRFRRVVEFDSEKILGQELIVDDVPVVSIRALEFREFSGIMLPTRAEATWHEEGMSGTFTMDGWMVNIPTPEIKEPKGFHRRNLEKF